MSPTPPPPMLPTPPPGKSREGSPDAPVRPMVTSVGWQDSRDTLRKLAAAYALGTLAGPARRRFEAVMQVNAEAAQAVADWNRRFAPLAAQLPRRAASPALWDRIEQAAFGPASVAVPAGSALAPDKATAATDQHKAKQPGAGLLDLLSRWLSALCAPMPAAALAMGLVLGLVLPGIGPLLRDPQQATELPESYVGVLATAEGRTGLIVSSLRQGRVIDLKRVVAVPIPEGRTQFLWIIDASGQASPVAPMPPGPFVRVPLPQAAEQLFAKAVELAVSVEVPGTTPSAPGSPFVYRGLCGKLWRLPAG